MRWQEFRRTHYEAEQKVQGPENYKNTSNVNNSGENSFSIPGEGTGGALGQCL